MLLDLEQFLLVAKDAISQASHNLRHPWETCDNFIES